MNSLFVSVLWKRSIKAVLLIGHYGIFQQIYYLIKKFLNTK
ncbi:hypothetical protein G436_4100 [Leptospira interrogans serovar Hardjo str. Norma]|uniref:Uncharacterized protein n=1 Tax=Leptospira interrogans serovar Hardjo str. Norma TaxID=1279460 RepID=A0A0M4NZL6_LEPIR|nr:hypothetical protein G436_4100 [Leptospira interrogans serovar Hardjo str. Norma]